MPSGIAINKSIPFAIGSDHLPGFSKLIEEQGEVLQEIGKIIGTATLSEHWDGQGLLKDRLEDEIADVRAAQVFLAKYNSLDWKKIEKRASKKLRKFERWHRNIQQGRDPNDDGET